MMAALPGVSASVAVKRRPKEVSPALSVIVISTNLQFTYVSLTSIANTLRICLNWFGYVRIIQGQMIDAAGDTSVAQKMSDASA